VDLALSIRRMGGPLKKMWRHTSLWVRVDAPGTWYLKEVRRTLQGIDNLPVAVTPTSQVQPQLLDFSLHPYICGAPSSPPPTVFDMEIMPLANSELRCLRVLARLRSASLIEIASQAKISLPTARQAMQGLEEKDTVLWNKNEKKWEIRRRKGLSTALRSLGLPPGITIRSEKRYNQGDRHLRTSRLWPAWLKKGLGDQVDIWAGWSEPRLSSRKAHPDALAWGIFQGKETLFWLEVDSGHLANEKMLGKLFKRLNKATAYARGFGLGIVFAFLGPPRTIKEAAKNIGQVPHDAALIFAPWTKFGELPMPVWGQTMPGTRQLKLLLK